MDEYKTTDPELKKEVSEWKAAVYKFAEECENIQVFSTSMLEGPLFTQMSDLIYKITMENYDETQGAANAEEVQKMYDSASLTQDDAPPPLPTIREYLEQYRYGYDVIKETKYRKKTIKAYDDLFAVADRTDDLMEGQIIIEKEGLVRKMTAVNGREVAETLLEAMDPLFEAVRGMTEETAEQYADFLTPEEITYRSSVLKIETIKKVNRSQIFVWLGAAWALLTLEYQKGKRAVHAWPDDKTARIGFNLMNNRRKRMRQLHKTMVEVMGITWDDLMANEFIKNNMLGPVSLDIMARCKRTLLADNIDAIDEIVREEVLSDLTILEVLKRNQKTIVAGNVDHEKSNQTDEEYHMIASEKNSSIPYFIYMESLSDEDKMIINKQANVKLPGEEKKDSKIDLFNNFDDFDSSGNGENNKMSGMDTKDTKDNILKEKTTSPTKTAESTLKGLGRFFKR
jgi:hypothetical protein